MADNYTSFSFEVKCPSEGAAEHLEEYLYGNIRSSLNPDGKKELYLTRGERDGDTVWVASEDECDLELLVEVLQDYLLHHDPRGSIGFAWANTCSKLRPGEFGGGAVFITATGEQWHNLGDWLSVRQTNHAKFTY